MTLRTKRHTRTQVNSQSKEVVAYTPTKTAHIPPYPPAMKDFAFSITADAPELNPAVTPSDESPLLAPLCIEVSQRRKNKASGPLTISSYLLVWGKETILTCQISERITGLGPHDFRSGLKLIK